MKKILLAAICLLSTGSAMALDNEPKEGVTSMAFLGLTTSRIRGNVYDAGLWKYKSKVGGTLGLRLDYVLPNAHGTYITGGVDWTMKGGRYSTPAVYVNSADILDTRTEDATVKANLHYMEIPIRVGFRYNVNKQIGVYGELGPYFAIGVGGKHKFSVDADGTIWNEIEEASTWKAFKKSQQNVNFQRWDCGLGFRVGAEYNKHYNLMFGCDWGFTDMYRDDYRDAVYPIAKAAGYTLDKVKNFQFSLAFGYRF